MANFGDFVKKAIVNRRFNTVMIPKLRVLALFPEYMYLVWIGFI